MYESAPRRASACLVFSETLLRAFLTAGYAIVRRGRITSRSLPGRGFTIGRRHVDGHGRSGRRGVLAARPRGAQLARVQARALSRVVPRT
jgi:hypothetical protein